MGGELRARETSVAISREYGRYGMFVVPLSLTSPSLGGGGLKKRDCSYWLRLPRRYAPRNDSSESEGRRLKK